MVSEKEIKTMMDTIDKLIEAQKINNELNDVLTFSEACILIGKAPNYFTGLVKSGKIKEGVDYRMAGRIGLIRKNIALSFK